MLIQFLLIAAVILLLVFFLRHHGTSRGRASGKIGFVLFLIFGAFAVLRPGLVTRLAELVGVGRGTDLVLYALVVAFAFATINTYLRFREWELRQARLARAVALRDAEPPLAAKVHSIDALD
jgi:small membrane protein